jgi:hypothetical protein
LDIVVGHDARASEVKVGAKALEVEPFPDRKRDNERVGI